MSAVEVEDSAGLVDGFMIERPMSARDALENLLAAFALDAIESEGVLKFRSRKRDSILTLTGDDYVETDAAAPLFALSRAQESELPDSLKLLYAESSNDYRNAVVEARKTRGESAREIVLELPCATTQAVAQARAHVLLQENWSGRETISFALPPSHLALEPGDVVTLGPRELRIASIHDGAARKLNAASYEASVYEPPPTVDRGGNGSNTGNFRRARCAVDGFGHCHKCRSRVTMDRGAGHALAGTAGAFEAQRCEQF